MRLFLTVFEKICDGWVEKYDTIGKMGKYCPLFPLILYYIVLIC